MSRIRVLPETLINQIAAGEVIERPASVVKELFENALDAGATRISLQLESGGRRRIRVEDDGGGMDHDDALLAFERHATSKIGSADALGRIETLGFRGEALPAIASVARVSLVTSADGRNGTRVDVEGGRILRAVEAGHPRGTTIDVRDLFFNTPARAKFLRSASTEMGHISDLVADYSAALPGVHILLTHEGRAVLDAPASSGEAERIRRVFGETWSDPVAIGTSRAGLTLRGWLAPVAGPGSARRRQRLYVNGRLVRDRLISHAAASALEESLPKGHTAAIFLFLECDPAAVDVNVHPAKSEVRFADPGGTHSLVREAITGALRGSLPAAPLEPPRAATAAVVVEGGLASARGASVPPGDGPRGSRLNEAVMAYMVDARSRPAGPPARPAGVSGQPSLAADPEAGGVTVLAHYRHSYIVAADAEGLLLVDQHAAHERILYEQILREQNRPGARQGLLFNATVTLPRRLSHDPEGVLARLEEIGFAGEPFGEATLLIREAPAILASLPLASVLQDVIAELDDEEGSGPSSSLDSRRRLAATVACHAAVKVPWELTPEKMNFLIRELFRTETPLRCPHGRPSVVRFTLPEIEKAFHRR